MRRVHWVAVTNDKKTGPIPVSYSGKETCPDTCSLKEGGCYAWGLFYIAKVGERVASGQYANTLRSALERRTAVARIVRHRIAGDMVGDIPGTLQDCADVETAGLQNIGYTHAWKEEEVRPLKKWFRASCQSIEEVIEARSKGWGATLIVDKGTLTSAGKKTFNLPNGETAYLCPARKETATARAITCNDCTLCKISDKTVSKTVIFEAHGNAANLKKIKGKV